MLRGQNCAHIFHFCEVRQEEAGPRYVFRLLLILRMLSNKKRGKFGEQLVALVFRQMLTPASWGYQTVNDYVV